jgi:hypothetical protein
MLEYVQCKHFNYDIERKKHLQLPNYFMEKYGLVSDILSEDVLRSKLAQSKSHDKLMRAISYAQELTSPECKPQKKAAQKGMVWVQGLCAIEEEIMKRVEEEHIKQQKRSLELQRLSEETGKILQNQPKKRKRKAIYTKGREVCGVSQVSLPRLSLQTGAEEQAELGISDDSCFVSSSMTPMSTISSAYANTLHPEPLNSYTTAVSPASCPVSPVNWLANPVKMIRSSVKDQKNLNALLLKNVASKRNQLASPKY